MATSNLTAERLRELLHYDPETGVFKRFNFYRRSDEVAGSKTKDRVFIYLDGKLYGAHRLAWLYTHGEWPTNTIDHIDGNPLNNKIKNLRDIPHHANIENVTKPRKHNASGVLGVEKHGKSSWRARLLVGGVKITIGRFKTIEDAHSAYLELKRMHHAGCTI
jgi:hypothetical protein